MNINYLLNTVSQAALTYRERLIGAIQKNKIVTVALVALGCLAVYLCKRINNHQSAQLAAKTPQRNDTDRAEVSTPAKTQDVFEQTIRQDEKRQEDEPVAVQENQEENKELLPTLPSPLPSPKEDQKGVLDEKIEEETLSNSDPTPDPIEEDPVEEDPVELQIKLMEQQDNRRKLISDGVKTGPFVTDLEQYIETTDDLIHLLNERASFASAEAIRRNDPDYLGGDMFLNPLFFRYTASLGRTLESKFNIPMVEFAVRHVKERMNRMYLAYVFHSIYVSILDTSLTKDEIIDFLKDIDGSDLHRQYGAPFVNLRQYSCRFPGAVFDSIFPGTGEGGPHAANFKEKNTKGIAIFKEFFAKGVVNPNEKFKQQFINCLKDHNPELLQALFDLGYQNPVLPAPTKEQLEKLAPRQKAIELGKNSQRQKEILTYLKNRNLKAGQYIAPSTYNDYDRLNETINLLIKNNFLELETFKVQSSHDLIIQEFRPVNFVVLHMLESMHCDLQILMSLAKKIPCNFDWEFKTLLHRAMIAIADPNQFEGGLRACQFLHDHYSELEEDVKEALKEALVWALKEPNGQIVKQHYFDDLGL